ncbi:MAG TPA: glycosyltransferase family 4 protein [Burkholderiaceae bacterium]|nr:glycosyltransferase family 4 protein [Burkholderiaceae bacterium]
MRPLRVLHSEAATSFGGQEHRIYKEMLAMRERGHHLELVCQPDALLVERVRAEGFTVHTTPMNGHVNFIKSVAKIRRVLRKSRFDVLNTHSRRDTLIAGVAGRLAGTPLIVRTRHLAIKAGSLLSYTWIPHRVTTVSDYVRINLIKAGVPPGRIATVYSPIELPPPVEHSTLRDELGLAVDDVVVGCVAVMREKKGHMALLEAIEPLFNARPALHLVLVGSGSPVFERVQAYVKEHGLARRVHLLGTRRDVPNLLAGCDLFALATEQEASGTVFVEAAAAGLPVIGTDVGGVSEMLREGETGWLVPVGDTQALRAALERLVDDRALRKRMGEAGRRLFRDEGKFSLETLAQNTERCYVEWLRERRA